MKHKRIPIKRLFEASENLADLEARLAKNGLTFSNPEELHDFLKWNWIEANKDKIAEIRAQPVEPISELPHSRLNYRGMHDEDIVIKVYGLVHGGPGIRASHSVKRFIRKTAKKIRFTEEQKIEIKNLAVQTDDNWAGYHFHYLVYPEKHDFQEDYVTEPGFAKEFGLDNARELDAGIEKKSKKKQI